MKRSYLIQAIDYLISTSPDYPSAEDIMSCIESAGMLPPTRQATSWAELGIKNDNDSECPRFRVNMWEPE